MKGFAIIAAVDSKGGLGKGGALAWNLPDDMKHFKEVTASEYVPGFKNAVIMGRKTWESIPERFRPLRERENAVITRSSLRADNIKVFASLDAAIAHYAEASHLAKIFVIGGATVYGQAISHAFCHEIYLTRIDRDFQCDVFFPPIPSTFMLRDRGAAHSAGEFPYHFEHYVRRF